LTHSGADEASRDFWERRWQQSGGGASEREIQRATALLAMIPEKTRSVLEVGCGAGLIVNRVTAAETMGIDLSASALRDVTGPSLQCSVEDLPFDDGRYDLVIASEVLEHLPTGVCELALSEIARVASSNILISVPNREYLAASVTKCPACGCRYHRNLHQRSYSPKNLKGLFEGFVLTDCHEIGEKEPRRSMFEVFLRRAVGASAPPWGTVCPNCMAVHDAPEASGTATGATPREGEVKRLLRRHEASWLAALYERT